MASLPFQLTLNVNAPQLLRQAGSGDATVYNASLTATIMLSNVASKVGGFPLSPGMSLTHDGVDDLYAWALTGTPVAVVFPGSGQISNPKIIADQIVASGLTAQAIADSIVGSALATQVGSAVPSAPSIGDQVSALVKARGTKLVDDATRLWSRVPTDPNNQGNASSWPSVVLLSNFGGTFGSGSPGTAQDATLMLNVSEYSTVAGYIKVNNNRASVQVAQVTFRFADDSDTTLSVTSRSYRLTFDPAGTPGSNGTMYIPFSLPAMGDVLVIEVGVIGASDGTISFDLNGLVMGSYRTTTRDRITLIGRSDVTAGTSLTYQGDGMVFWDVVTKVSGTGYNAYIPTVPGEASLTIVVSGLTAVVDIAVLDAMNSSIAFADFLTPATGNVTDQRIIRIPNRQCRLFIGSSGAATRVRMTLAYDLT